MVCLKEIECYLIKHPSVKESYEDIYKEIYKEIQLLHTSLLESKYGIEGSEDMAIPPASLYLRGISEHLGFFEFKIDNNGVGIIMDSYKLRGNYTLNDKLEIIRISEDEMLENRIKDDIIDFWKKILLKYFQNQTAIINDDNFEEHELLVYDEGEFTSVEKDDFANGSLYYLSDILKGYQDPF
ncbi:hypothetical protein LCGC14_1468830 [marine sediment metagenome]|uniref:Uncharacterized protein n=1 Tax=marine sediment metagenome TaxID=412755 RepID=A0A0F9JDI5_9ZZZZ